MKRVLTAPTICGLCAFPTRFASHLFINSRGWVDACLTCDARHGGLPQIDPSRLPPAAEVTVPFAAGAGR